MAEKEETIVGLPEPDAGGGIYKFLSMLSPTRFSVVEPRRSAVVDDMGGYALVKPGKYAFDSFTTPQIVTSGIDAFKAFMDDPVESAKTGVVGAIEGMGEEIDKGILAASTGITDTFDPETNTYDRFDPLSLSVAAGAPIAYGTMRGIKAMADAPDGSGVPVGMLGGGDSAFTSQIQRLMKDAREIRTRTDRESAFNGVANLQRGFPELKMGQLQGYMGGGVNSYAIEHGGDLLHRMMEYGGDFSSNAKTKIKNLTRVLNSPYGFEREIQENTQTNYRFDLETAKERGEAAKATTLEEFEQNIDKGLGEYAAFHANLPVFNELQLAARNFAVALGRKDYDEARYNLSVLDEAIDDGSFDARNQEFDPEFETKAGAPGSNFTVLGMLGGGKPVTTRSLRGGRGGIRGLAHGIKYYDGQKNVPDHMVEAFFGTGIGGGIASMYDTYRGAPALVSPSERYAISPEVLKAAEGANMTIGDLVKEFGLSNRVRNIVSDSRAASAEINRPGFSVGTDPVLSLTTFTATESGLGPRAADRTEGVVAIEPKENIFVKTGEVDADGYPVYAPREMTMHDVQDLSPSQYLLAAYDPDKPLLRKPNTKFNESEVHVAEDASHALNVRPLTDREEEDLVASLNFEQKSTEFARKADEAMAAVSGFDPRSLDFKDGVDQSMRMMALAVDNPTAVGQKSLSIVEEYLGGFAKNVVQGYRDGYLRLDELYPEGSAAISDGRRLYDAAKKFSTTKSLLKVGPYEGLVRREAAELQTQILRDSFTGESRKFAPFFEFKSPFGQSSLPTEIDLVSFNDMFTPEQVIDLNRIELARTGYLTQSGILGNKPADPKKLTDKFLQSPNAAAIVELLGYIDEDGVFRRNSLPATGDPFPDVGSPKAFLEGDLKQQYLTIQFAVTAAMNKLHGSKDKFDERVDEVPAAYLRPALAQIFDSNTDRERALTGQVNKGRHAKAYNDLFRQYRNERDELFNIIKELANKGVPGSRQRTGQVTARLAGDDAYYQFREAARERLRRGPLTGPDLDLYEGIVDRMRFGPRPGAKLYEDGGDVSSADRAFQLVADAVNRTGRMPLFIKRVLDPKSPKTANNETMRLSDSEMDGKYYVYPTIFPTMTPDGPRLTRLDDKPAFNRAIDSGEYLVFDTEAEASTVARGFSDNIKPQGRPIDSGVAGFIPYMVQ